MTSSPKPADPELDTALAHHLAGRLADAERLYKAILVSRPDHADALHLIGVAEVQSGNAAAAIGWIARAIEINPKVAAYHSNFGKALSDVGRLAEASESCAQALAIDRDCVDAYVNLGFVHNRLGETDKAIASFRRALLLKPDHAEARANLGAALCQAGQLDEADVEYSALLLQDPKAMRAYLGLGAIRHEQRRFCRGRATAPRGHPPFTDIR
jgi:protein O-GlcNAc transferase